MQEYKKYIRCHIVKATPMTRGEYNAHRGGWEMTAKENAADEGYHVVYPDGYESWCPKAQFEEAGSPIDGMTFGQAIDACCYRGAKIQRKGWNGEGQFVRYEVVDAFDGGGYNGANDHKNQSTCFVFHFVTRKTGETGIQVGWLASQADMKANDWRIVE